MAAECSCGWHGSVEKKRGFDYMTTSGRLHRKVAGHLGGSKAAHNKRHSPQEGVGK